MFQPFFIMIGYGLVDRGYNPSSDTIFLFSKAFGTTLGPIKTPIQWMPGVKRPELEDNRSPLCSAERKNAWIYTSTWCLIKHGAIFILIQSVLVSRGSDNNDIG
jgi:hypothetical protein